LKKPNTKVQKKESASITSTIQLVNFNKTLSKKYQALKGSSKDTPTPNNALAKESKNRCRICSDFLHEMRMTNRR